MKILKAIMISIILMFLLGCNKSEENIFFEGNIVGFINLLDETGYEFEDKSGVNISIEGLTYSANTNEDGRFELANVPAGTYNFIYSKTGFGIYKKFSYQFVGGNVPAILNERTIFQQPSVELKSLDISFKDNIMNIMGEITEPNQFKIQTFISDSANVSDLNYEYSSTHFSYVGSEYSQFTQNIYILNTHYSPGDKIYIALYFINPYEKYGYYDYENGKSVYGSTVKASGAISIIIE